MTFFCRRCGTEIHDRQGRSRLYERVGSGWAQHTRLRCRMHQHFTLPHTAAPSGERVVLDDIARLRLIRALESFSAPQIALQCAGPRVAPWQILDAAGGGVIPIEVAEQIRVRLRRLAISSPTPPGASPSGRVA